MKQKVLLDAGVVTRCRRRVHLENDPSTAGAPPAPLDLGIEQRIADATEHRHTVAKWLGTAFGADWTEIPRGTPADRAERTVAAMRAGIALISSAQLPDDADAGRRGTVDLLVRTGSGYVPVLVVRHKVTDPGSGARVSPIDRPMLASATVDQTRKVRAQPRDQLRLAHAVRLLQACGMSGEPDTGGVIGVDADVVVWHDLQAPNWPGGRTVFTEYDQRFADRIEVATAAANGDEPKALPSRITECRGCPWWPTCREQLHETQDVSLVVRGEDAVGLRQMGLRTVSELAALTPETAADLPLTGTHPTDAVLLAKAWLRELPLVRRTRQPHAPRADVEIDVDMESYGDSGAYLWGCWLSGTDLGERPGYHAFASWEPLPCDDEARSFGEFWTWFSGLRRRTYERGLSFRAYCYNELAENRWLLASAERFAGQQGVPSIAEVREFIQSAEWVDIFALVRDQFLCPNGKGLKVIAPCAGFGWRDPEASGENSMRWYRDAVALDGGVPQTSQRDRILRYNEDDVRATWTIRNWMTSDAVHEIPFADDL